MEPHQIRSFLVVAEAGSVTLAAEQLNVTQPAVTQHIHSLERSLGCALFERTRRGMILTRAGQLARKRLAEAIGLLDSLRHQIGDAQSQISGDITLGLAIHTGSGLAGCLKTFVEKYPLARVAIKTGRSEEVCAWVADMELEIAVTGWVPPGGALKSVPLFTQRFVLVAPRDHPLAGRRIGPEQLKKIQLIRSTRGPWLGINWSSLSPDLAQSRVQGDTLESIRSLVCAGAGCAFLPEADVQLELKTGLLRRIDLVRMKPIERTIYAIYKKGRHLEAGMLALIRHLERSFSKK